MANHCSSCNKVFQSQEALNQHMSAKVHVKPQPTKQLISQPSGSNTNHFSLSSPPMRQQIIVLGGGRRCDSCNKSFKDKPSLDQHLKSAKVHLIGLRRCDSCNKSFKNQTSLDQHLESAEVHRKTVSTLLKVPPNVDADTHQHDVLSDPIPSNSIASSSMGKGRDGTSINRNSPWSIIPDAEIPGLFENLSRECHSPEDLLKNKYLLHPYSASDISGLRKCQICGRLAKSSEHDRCYFHPGRSTSGKRNKRRPCTNCGAGISTKGCDSSPTHNFQEGKNVHKYRNFATCPSASVEKLPFKVLVLDCEMVEVRGAWGLESEVVLVCAVDFFTGAVVLNSLVLPDETVRDWRTEIHGITSSAMGLAVSQGLALAGWNEARTELWKLMDQNTILVGHALQHDLDVLKMVHTRVVDSAILARNAVATHRQWGLQRLCKELVGFEIRSNKGGVHDCLEDVLATREVVLLCVREEQQLADWAKVKRLELKRDEERRKMARKNRASKRPGQQKQETTLSSSEDNYYTEDTEDESDEVLRWSDIAVDLGWPHPDTGYDPWSD